MLGMLVPTMLLLLFRRSSARALQWLWDRRVLLSRRLKNQSSQNTGDLQKHSAEVLERRYGAVGTEGILLNILTYMITFFKDVNSISENRSAFFAFFASSCRLVVAGPYQRIPNC